MTLDRFAPPVDPVAEREPDFDAIAAAQDESVRRTRLSTERRMPELLAAAHAKPRIPNRIVMELTGNPAEVGDFALDSTGHLWEVYPGLSHRTALDGKCPAYRIVGGRP